MENIIWAVFCILAVPLGFGILIGWLIWGRKAVAPDPRRPREPLHAEWLAHELNGEHMQAILTGEQRNRIREHYRLLDLEELAPTRAPSTSPPWAEKSWAETAEATDAASKAQEQLPPAESIAEPSGAVVPEADVSSEPEAAAAPVAAAIPQVAPAPPEPRLRSPLAPESEPEPVVAARDALDPAVLMLYLGAFLVVAAGIVYASYNWADLGSWQKLGLLGATTLAFGVTGWVLLGNERVRQAAETFVAISALLVPANAIAAWSVFEESQASTAVIVLLGALITTLVYGVFSKRPGGWIYDYGASLAGLLAVGSVLPAAGMHWGWGGVAVLLAVAAIRELSEQLPDGWDHLRKPLTLTGVAAIPIGVAVGLGSVLDDVTVWIVPVTFAAATMALATDARRSAHAAWGILTSITAIATVAGVVAALDPERSWAWAFPALATSVALIVAGEYGPAWLRKPPVRLALHIEAILGLFVATYASLIDVDQPWVVTGMFAAAVVVSALVALVRASRWWLLFTGGFAAGLWFTILAHVDTGDWNTVEMLLFIAPLPVLLAVPAFRLDRISERQETPKWGEPLWLVAGVLAVGFTALPFAWAEDGDALPIRTLAATCVAFGLVTLVAAWSMDRPPLRIGYGLWTILAAGLAVYSLDLAVTDNPVAMIAILAGLVAISVFVLRPGASGLVALFSPRRVDQARAEIVVHVAAIGLLLLSMVGAALRYISTVSDDLAWADLPGVRWTWIAYLTTFSATTIATAVVGWRLGAVPSRGGKADSGLRVLPGLTIAQGGLAALLLLRMSTTDTMVWTWVGLGAGVLLLALPLIPTLAGTTNGYGTALASDASWAGLGLLVVSTAANMSMTGDSASSGEYGASAAIYLGVGLAVLAIGLKAGRTPLSYVAFVAFTLGVGQFARAVSDSEWAVILAFAILAWVVMGAALVLPADGLWNGQSRVWINSALGIGAFAVLVPGTNFIDVEDTDTARQVFVIALVSMAGLLAVDARLRKDRLRAILGSALAMLGLLVQISIRDPETVLWYTIPLGLYLLGLGVVIRRDARLRDILLGAGSGVLLVPALLLAQAEGSFAYLLLAGGFSIGLFLIGIALRLRVLIAAGVIGVTIIVLRMLVDAVLALESWITLLTVGLVLLGGGTASLVWKEALRARLERLQAAWHDMG